MVEGNGGGQYVIVPFPENRKRIDVGDYYGDYTLIKTEVGWQPQTTLREGIARLLEYYRMNLEHYL